MPNAQCPMPHAPCPMPNAPCPMPNTQYPITKNRQSLMRLSVISVFPINDSARVQLSLIMPSWRSP
ncbi:MAG: hypothetical protein RMY29_025420 [Nostoc sp. CreGUA01]